MSKVVSIVVLVLGLALGLYGFNKYTKSSEGGEIFGIEISVQNKEAVNNAYLMMGLGALLAIGGLYGVVKK